MPEYTTISKKVERRTYLKGKFTGKYIGYIDNYNSNQYHENFYNLEILDGEITIYKNKEYIKRWNDKELNQENWQFASGFSTLPEPIKCKIFDTDGGVKNYKIVLQEPKLTNCYLSNQINETDKVFGDIEGEVSGYIVHFDTVNETVEVPKDNTETTEISTKLTTDKKTGNKEIKGNYERWEYYYTDGSTYWGDWVWKKNKEQINFVEAITDIIGILFLVAIITFVLFIGWRIILPLLVLSLGTYIFVSTVTFLAKFIKWSLYIIGLSIIVIGIFSFYNSITTIKPQKRTSIDDSLDSSNNIIQIDSDSTLDNDIISHYHSWKDYNGRKYNINLKVEKSTYNSVKAQRNNLNIPLIDFASYNYVVDELYNTEKGNLNLVYNTFDSLRIKYGLKETQFAEAIVSCIQHIPYTLILNDACNANIYSDKFIRQYLEDGGKCQGFVKYGLLSPTEFLATLDGDCDTRTLLLFTLLDHFGYDVTMLSSEIYKHSIIGIQLPYDGISKKINNKKYVLWETTDKGFRPGALPREFSNASFWNITLISNN